MSLSAMPLILRCTTTDSRPIEPRHQCRKLIALRSPVIDGARRMVRGHLAGARADPTGTLVGPTFSLRDEEWPGEGLGVEHRFELGRHAGRKAPPVVIEG